MPLPVAPAVMLILLSPAKTLDLESPPRTSKTTTPAFLDQSESLVRTLRRYSAPRLGQLMNVSDALATLNRERFRDWRPEHRGGAVRPAIQAFRGDVYVGLDADTLSSADLDFAQERVRILSGLYGVLRPLDCMRAYRLEMGTKLPTRRGKTLYDFWGDRVAQAIDAEAAATAEEPIVNLASKEYSKVVDGWPMKSAVVTPVFHDEKNGDYRIISFFAKKARGALARHLVRSRSTSPDAIHEFTALGYRYSKRESSDGVPVFRRSEKAAAPYLASA